MRAERARAKSDTESGMTSAQRKAINAFEDRRAFLKTERAVVIDPEGHVMAQSERGTRNRTHIPFQRGVDYSNAYISHNHPSAVKDGGVSSRIGSSLSSSDLESAVSVNAKGMRARSGDYIYSMERGSNGWGGNSRAISRDWESAYSNALYRYSNGRLSSRRDLNSYVERYARDNNYNISKTNEHMRRIQVVAIHQANKVVAKKYGMKYTRSKVK